MPINFLVKLGVTVAMEAMQMGLQAAHKTTGPRLDELTVTVADFGTPIPRFLGVRRFACPVFFAEDLKEVQHSTKVKGGGKQTSFSYLATFAAAIADGPIDKVLKIFFDDKLVYDATGAGPISYASSIGIDLNSVMRVYKGTEDQLPDPRYSAWCEDRYGANSAPAYRGISYLFFEELPVDNFGNRIPQISVIATSAASGAFPYETLAGGGSLQDGDISPDGTKLVLPDGQVWDLPTRTLLWDSSPAHAPNGQIAANDDGSFYVGGTGSGFSGVSLVDQGGNITELSSSTMGGLRQIPAGLFGTGTGKFQQLAGDTVVDTTVGFNSTWFFGDLDGKSLAVGGQSSTGFGFYDIDTDTEHLISASTSGEAFAFDNGAGQYLVWQQDNIYLVDKATFAITAGPVATTGMSGANKCAFKGIAQGAAAFWLGFTQYSSRDLSTLQTHVSGDWGAGSGATEPTYSSVLDALLTRGTLDTGITVRYLERAGNAGTTLGAIVSKMADAAGMTDYDTSALTQFVAGYSWTRGDVKSQMEPVLDMHDVDARPHDFTIEFKKRGSASSGTILTADFAKPDPNTPRYKGTWQQDTDLPKMLRVNFADTAFDQQINNILSPLVADVIDSQQDVTVDMTTYAADVDTAQQLGDRYMRRLHNSAESIENSLTAQYRAIEPADVKTISLDGIEHNARLTKLTIMGGRMDCTFVRDETAIAVIDTTATGQGLDARDQEVITFPAPVMGFVIDAPYREDSDDDTRPLLYDGAGAYAQLTFPSAVILEETGSGASAAYDQLFATVSSGATWGTCQGALGNVPSPWLWDRGNTLTVTLQSGSLTSVTEADINADPTLNLIVVGRPGAWEYVNFATATLNGDGSYTLSDFKRGRRGTEWACGLHAAGDSFVLASSLDVDEMGLDQVGATLSFKTQAVGRSLDSAPVVDIAPYQGQTLMPYAPASVKWAYDGTDLTGTITRRTRKGGAWNGGSTIPLGETTEAYEVDVYNGSTFKRTIAVSGTNVFTYTAAMATADGITLPTPPSVQIYQMSDAVGRGFALAA